MRLLTIIFAVSLASGQTNDPEPILKQAIQLHQSGDFTKAIPLYRAYLKARPDSPDALSNLGAALAHEGKYAEAITEYSKALKLQPKNPQAIANLGLAYYKTGQISQAREQFQTARQLMPANQQITFLLADCESRLGSYKAAIAILEPLEKTLAEDQGFDYLFGTALIRDHQTDRGLTWIDRILRRGDSAEARLLLGTTKLDAHDYAAAREDLEKAVELNPKLPEAHAYLGLALVSIGDATGAAKAFQTELTVDPFSFIATFQLAVIAATEQRNAEARRLFERGLALRPGDAGARYQLATLDLSAGNVDKARIALEALVKESPDFTAAHIGLATVYFRLQRREDGDRERAIVRRLNAEAQAAETKKK